MRKQPVLLLFCLLLLFGGGAAGAAEWYLSNPAGMPLEKQSSALVALRNKYSLSVERVPLSEVPDMLREYHNGEWIIEVHILFENGEESRRQWIFRNKQGIARLVSAFDPPASENDSEAPPLVEFPPGSRWGD
ncbi:hypothetical protein FACS1894106_3830 [Spirochaetia bacterium]|nr:hypothetical protein FACS1894106_3830 [Spirochaetia bacterium]